MIIVIEVYVILHKQYSSLCDFCVSPQIISGWLSDLDSSTF